MAYQFIGRRLLIDELKAKLHVLSLTASNKFIRHRGSGRVTPAEITVLSGLIEEESGEDRKREGGGPRE